VAQQNGFAAAENNALMRQARAAGQSIMAADGIHPNYLGQSIMARAILDAMGHADVPLPKEFDPRLFPGVIRSWRMRPAPCDERGRPVPLTAATAAELKPDASWVTYTLPDPAGEGRPSAEDWLEQIRRNGFGLAVEERVGKGLVQAYTTVETVRPADVYVNTGIGISTVWLNGVRIHEQGGRWTGFHAGKERIPVRLRAGPNVLVAELQGQHFFLSITDTLIWEQALR
jgi:hypothetical protein